ncbi:myosin-1-like isoform X2 [Wolffia australiana]
MVSVNVASVKIPWKNADESRMILEQEENGFEKVDLSGVSALKTAVERRRSEDEDEDSPYGGSIQNDNVLFEATPLPESPPSRSLPFSRYQANPRWSGTQSFAIKKRPQVWHKLSNGEWVLGELLSSSGEENEIRFPDNEVLRVSAKELLPANPDILDGVNDLMQLSYLNEPSVLYNLEYRYGQDMIYTKAGPVLVSINPFKEVDLYGDEYVEGYRSGSLDSPHVYAIADAAFCEMLRDERNQSIIISGESGAGKTEAAKITMQYLASLGGGGGIEYEILQTNPILEAFGNAKTSRNDNSSRFGKLIEIQFGGDGKISSARIQTFLLEKSRVVQCADGERSYHVFYQLCHGAPSDLKEKLNLKAVGDYEYLKQGGCFSISGVDDAERFHSLLNAFEVIHVSKEDQYNIFAILAAILWLGNVTFRIVDDDDHVDTLNDEALSVVSSLLGCSVDNLGSALCTRRMKAGSEDIVQKLTLSQALDSRDALAKSLYASLFEWLVERINKSIQAGKSPTGRSISILDIYGFEFFEKNSFEQFCINYANERLQQHFNRHLLKLEQEEYIQDGIAWSRIDFEDNQACLGLFEKKPLGLLTLLDEESTFPNGSDLTFAEKLRQHLGSNSFFRTERGRTFGVRHYAGEVLYDTSGFLEKNRDLLHIDCIQLLASCMHRFPKDFASKMLSQPPCQPRRSSAADGQRLSVAMKFKGQLFQLMQRLDSTTPHFIRCIKPNSMQTPGAYDQDLVARQLRCCGVLEVVRISRSGYPTRLPHQKFASRYGFLLRHSSNALGSPLSVCVMILQQLNIPPDSYQLGYTKLFFRAGQIGALEDARNAVLHGILRFQSCFRGHVVRRQHQLLRNQAISLQSFIRGEQARRLRLVMSVQRRLAMIIQTKWRSQQSRRNFLKLCAAALILQSGIRGENARRRCRKEVNAQQERAAAVPMSALTELQQRVQRAELGLRKKEEENEVLHQRLQQYESRWSEYEHKMRSMEATWQLQMRSLQSSLSVARRSLASAPPAVALTRDMGLGLTVIGRLTEELDQRSRVFADDASLLVEVKSGQAEIDLDPDREFRRLKLTFHAWKKDFGHRLRETKAILLKLGASEDSSKKKWWVR